MNENPQSLDNFLKSDSYCGIAPEKLDDIFICGQHSLLGCGESLFNEGDLALKCYFVKKGCLKLVKIHQQGKEVLFRYINSGEMTAAVSVFQKKNYPVTAIAVSDTEVVAWDKDNLLKLMLGHAPLAVSMLGYALERIDELQTRYLEVCTEPVEQRLAHALLRIMQKSSHKTRTGVQIDHRLSRKDLANYTGTTLYTVSRILSSWKKNDWIESSREQIVITNPNALVKLAEAD